MKIILTGATGVLGSQVMYEILELFIKESIEGKLILISRGKKRKTALERINELLSSDFAPKILKDAGLEKLDTFIEIADTDLDAVGENFGERIKGAYFIHSAGYVNLSTDEEHRQKIFDENTKITKFILNNFHDSIKKIIYIGTAFSSGERSGLVENDFHNLGFIPKHRNAYENAKFHSENFVAQHCKALGLPFQILRPSVICGKMLGDEHRYFISKYMVFYLLAKFFYFAAQRNSEQENVRFIMNRNTGLNIIAVDYVAKVIVSVFRRDDIQQLNIVNHKSLNLVKGLELIMAEVGYSNYTIVENTPHFEYQNNTERLYYESIGKHLKPYLVASAKEYNTVLLNSILEIPILDDETFTQMIRYAKLNGFKDIHV
ncbi:SDR family oxidoreductase [Flavobacterium marginilacus]|uniref:SDR family oxidoreductase n=1 Tax=Flavobacterium marginilacus TaxID=3003256 RepID=UPI00248E691D|nr:SDR family oxidoreductase [Flavobacterium marginilacus]